jgi:predicted metal-dependent hydrolase
MNATNGPRRAWIGLQPHRLERTRTRRPVTKSPANGEEFTVLGVPHTLRLVDSTDADPAVTRPHVGELQMDQRLATRPAHARLVLLHWYAQQAQDWLDQHGEQLTPNTPESPTRLRASLRLSTALVAHRPHHELTLSWTAAQLDDQNLRTLIADTLGRATGPALRCLHAAYRNMWFGELADA